MIDWLIRMITCMPWVCVRLVYLYDYLYLLFTVRYCICRHVMVGWVEAVVLSFEGQDTQGGLDRL